MKSILKKFTALAFVVMLAVAAGCSPNENGENEAANTENAGNAAE